MLLINSFLSKSVVDWKANDNVTTITNKMGKRTLSYIPREGYKVVDSLSKIKNTQATIYLKDQRRRIKGFQQISNLNQKVRSNLLLDTLQVPSVRF